MSTRISGSVLDSIGNTPLVHLGQMSPVGGAAIYLKLEYMNPTGSKKDRMALAMIEGAEERGQLTPGMSVVEYSGGSTGTALALICSVKGYRFRLVTSDAFSQEKIHMMRALGAELEIIEAYDGGITGALIQAMVDRAAEIAQEPGTFYTDQLNNPDMVNGFEKLGTEFLEALGTDGITAMCDTVGTAGTLMGASQAFRKAGAQVELIALEPASSPILSSGVKGSHRVEGVGLGFVPAQLDPKNYDRVMTIDEETARETSRELARKEGIFAGTSTGMNVAGAIAIAQELGPNDTVVAVACDTGIKYLSEGLFDA